MYINMTLVYQAWNYVEFTKSTIYTIYTIYIERYANQSADQHVL